MLNMGLNYQAVSAALAIASRDGVESSWNREKDRYEAEVRFRPWYNGRETGIVVQLVSWQRQKCMNYAIFEHRNHDGLCVWRWETAFPSDTPRVEDIPGDLAPNKYTHWRSVNYGEGVKLADMISEDMENTWRDWQEA